MGLWVVYVFKNGREDVNENSYVEFDLLYFDQNFGLSESLWSFCAAEGPWWPRIAQKIQHCKDVARELKQYKNFLYNIVHGDKKWCFKYYMDIMRQSAD